MNHRPQDHPLLCRCCVIALGYWQAPEYMCPACVASHEATE